jgi:4,5-DOPA dioxygenase extradiol
VDRKKFIQSILSLGTMITLGGFKSLADSLAEQDQEMPAFFIGHGSPMNALEENIFTVNWRAIGKTIPKPKAILCISAHWETNGTFVTAMEKPKTIHDFGGFPKALFDTQYNAPGSVWLAEETQKVVTATTVGLDQNWGLDHGSWSVLKQIYPDADIPVIEFSLDNTKDAQYHYDLAKQLKGLRKKGVLIIGSGNMVHNFSYANFDFTPGIKNAQAWALEADATFKKLIADNDVAPLINYAKYSKAFALAAPTPEHYLPMLYTVALRGKNEKLRFFNDEVIGGSFSMTSIQIG